MKTWEMIKALTGNPKKKFKNQYGEEIRVLADNDLFFDGVDGHNYISITDEWEEVKEPVDFMEVLKRIKDSDGDIRLMLINDLYEVEIKNKTFDKVLYHLSIDYLDTSIADILLNGKWYIEED